MEGQAFSSLKTTRVLHFHNKFKLFMTAKRFQYLIQQKEYCWFALFGVKKTCKGWAGTQINSTMFCLKLKVLLLFVRSKTAQTNILERKSQSPKVKISFEKLWCLSSVLAAQTGFQKSKVQIHCLELWGVHHNISNLDLISFQCYTSVFFCGLCGRLFLSPITDPKLLLQVFGCKSFPFRL